jgi:hypothetical protein
VQVGAKCSAVVGEDVQWDMPVLLARVGHSG